MSRVLELESITAGYGDSVVLRGVDLTVDEGEVVALLGPNGAGKSTLLRAASGLVKLRSGKVVLDGRDLAGEKPHEFVRRGVCHLPEGRGIFPTLSVQENIVAQVRNLDKATAIERAAGHFPILGKRLRQTAGSLSGGEQQMLALARAFLTESRVIVVDEASFGLAPLMIDHVYDALAQLVAAGKSLIVVEQYVQRIIEIADTVHVLSRGEVVHRGKAADVDPDKIYEKYLGIDS